MTGSFRAMLVSCAVFLAVMAASGTILRADETPLATAIFAGGCFWCVESDFDQVDGVVETVSGYTGGHTENPTYKQVVRENTGHYEAVRITYDPSIVSYEDLLYVFWRTVDPTDAGGQFCDRGDSYRTAIFATDEAQFEAAEKSKADLIEAERLDDPIVTQIHRADTFWPAEDYHQNYYLKNSYSYKFYRFSCGRNFRVQNLWGDEAFGGYGHDAS